jgi:MFS family permease
MLFGLKILVGFLALRSFACVFVYPINLPGLAYALTLIGQIGAGMVLPFYNNLPAKIAGNWFGLHERELATSIAAISTLIGIAVEQLLSSLIVTSNTTSGFQNIPLLLFIQLILSIGCYAWVFFSFKEHPPSPPSKSAEEALKEEAIHASELELEEMKMNEQHQDVKKPQKVKLNSLREAFEKIKNEMIEAVQHKVS